MLLQAARANLCREHTEPMKLSTEIASILKSRSRSTRLLVDALIFITHCTIFSWCKSLFQHVWLSNNLHFTDYPLGHPASVQQSSEDKPATQPNTGLTTRREWASVKHTILKRSDVLRLLRSLDCPWQMNNHVTDARWTEQLTQATQPHSDPISHCCLPTKVTSSVPWLADPCWELRLWKTSIMSRASCKYFAS